MEIAALKGLSYPTVRKAIDLFVNGGWSAVKPAARGRSAGDGWLLSAAQRAAVRRTICDKPRPAPPPPNMDFLSFRVEEVDDRVSSLEAMALTRIDLHINVMAEVQAVLDWARCSFPSGHGPDDDGADWDHDIQVIAEEGGWHPLTVTFTGTA